MGQDREVGHWLREGLAKCGGHQSELGRLLGIQRQRMHRMLRGEGGLTDKQLITLLKLLKQLGCVLIALAGLTQAPDGGAAQVREPTSRNSIERPDTKTTSLATHCASFVHQFATSLANQIRTLIAHLTNQHRPANTTHR